MGIRQNLKRLRKDAGLSQTALAKMAGVSQQLISQLENTDGISTTELPALARALNVAVHEIDPDFADVVDRMASRDVPLVGYVGAGSVAHYYADSQGELDRVPAPDGWTPETVAVEIRGDSLGALFEHWLVYYDEVRSPVTNDLVGRLCVVGLPDDRVLVKRIRRAKTPGFYHLESNTEGTIFDVEIAWAARVKSMVPR